MAVFSNLLVAIGVVFLSHAYVSVPFSQHWPAGPTVPSTCYLPITTTAIV